MIMKRILVFSDSHHVTQTMMQVTLKVRPDIIIHLGDCINDARELQRAFPEIPVEMVPGNCDFSQDPGVRILMIDQKRIMICHGHQFYVKETLRQLEAAAVRQKADAVLFGHTHRLYYDYHNGLAVLNPGSISQSRYAGAESYGLMTIKNGQIDIQTFYAKDI